MNEHIYPILGKKIKRLRKSKGLTQDEVSALLGLSRASINNIENGRHRIQLHVLYGYSNLLETSIHDLLSLDQGEL